MSEMIVTCTQNANGQRRIYLGGKSSIEAWIEPNADNIGWTFHLESAVTGQYLSDDDKRAWAIHMLTSLAEELSVSSDDLASVPYEAIAALHVVDPYAGRRIAVPRRRVIDAGYMATPPIITRPQADFTHREHERHRERR